MSRGRFLFRLDQGDQPAGGTLEYRPFGTRSLKIEIGTVIDLPPLTLNVEGPPGGNGRIYTLAGPGRELQISWGGGHENGPPAMAEDLAMAFEKSAALAGDRKRNTIFFNVRHLGPGLPANVPLTVKAVREDGTLQASLTITLSRPPGYSDDVIRLMPAGEETGRWAPSNGNRLPLYDSRWWPSDTINYVSSQPPSITVERDGDALLVKWARDKRIASIKDLTAPTILDIQDGLSFELFHFDDDHLVLRAWFFWLDKSIGHKFFVGRHEVPDVERFDMLLRKTDGQVLLACTDLHWRENWGQLIEPADPLEATIGLTIDQKWEMGRKAMGKIFTHEDDTRPRYNPLGFIHRLAERLAAGDEVVVKRAKGSEAHVPSLNNIGQATIGGHDEPIVLKKETRTVHEMTSTDVRKG